MKKKSQHCKSKLAVFAVCAALVFAGCSSRKVQTVKVEAEANQIMDVLGENGVRAYKTEVGEGERKSFEIKVNGDDEMLAAAIQIMEDHCLGQPEPPEVEGGTVITSIEVERAREQRRMKMNIESQLRKLPGATCVNVNFVPPEDRSLAIKPFPSTASVLINYKTPTFPVSKEEVASLVARSVPALQPENVTVVLNAKPLRPMPENKVAYNFARVALISGIGFATILAFVSVVFVLRKKRRHKTPEDEALVNPDENAEKPPLIDNRYDFDEDEDVNLP